MHARPENTPQLQRLLEIMARLRDPQTGCPWDVAQTSQSISRYTLEEAYEVVEAIQSGDEAELCAELGDLLLQVVFHAQMAAERGAFTIEDVAQSISDKMEARHPHIFGTSGPKSAEEVRQSWEEIKANERRQKAKTGTLDDVALALPALVRAQKLQNRAARVGFDWNDVELVLDKFREEMDEFSEARTSGDQDHIEEEFGDLLFVMVNLGRHLGIESEEALKRINEKFTTRFGYIEKRLNEAAIDIQDADLPTMERYWQEAKNT